MSSGAAEALGRILGGFTTRLHLASDGCGRPQALHLTVGRRHHSQELAAVLDRIPPPPRLPLTPPQRHPDPLVAALERHARIEAALRAQGPNPFPDEIEEEEWSSQLAAFHFVGPLESTLLQNAEADIEALTEMLPEQVDEYPAGSVDPTQVACFLLYAGSLADLSEEELHADLLTTLAAGRQDTAALIRAELARRERELAAAGAPQLLHVLTAGLAVGPVQAQGVAQHP